jgi:DNA-binding response OmpR family regulator
VACGDGPGSRPPSPFCHSRPRDPLPYNDADMSKKVLAVDDERDLRSIRLDRERYVVRVDGQPLDITPIEFRLLAHGPSADQVETVRGVGYRFRE